MPSLSVILHNDKSPLVTNPAICNTLKMNEISAPLLTSIVALRCTGMPQHHLFATKIVHVIFMNHAGVV